MAEVEDVNIDLNGTEAASSIREHLKAAVLYERTRWIDPERVERLKTLVDFRDVVALLVDNPNWQGNAMSCPFHGTDSKPSFTYYHASNDVFCWGCPEEDAFWDHVKFVHRLKGISPLKALTWLEKEFNLPPWEASRVLEDDGDVQEENDLQIDIDQLFPSYCHIVRTCINSNRRDPESILPYAHEALTKWFTAIRDNDPLAIAKVIGKRRLNELMAAAEKLA